METMPIGGLTLYFDADERDAAELISGACEKTIWLARENWSLAVPSDCRVYVMTSWLDFIFHSAPWRWRVLLAPTLPIWYFRVSKLWRFAGGWMQRYGARRAVGIKPPRLIEDADRSMGDRIFVRETDVREKVQHIACHELTHAIAAHLKLPMWLNEGLAMLAVDKFFGRPSVRPETIETLSKSPGQTSPGEYRKVKISDPDAIVYHYVRGYWITRYLEDAQPALLTDILSQRYSHKALERKLAAALGIGREEFWGSINDIVVSHFRGEDRAG